MSPTAVSAALRAAAGAAAPIVFVASRNQVDSAALGGGYVAGWDQRGLRRYVERVAQRWPTVHWYIGRDHGGPWQRDDEYTARLPWAQARDRALRSLWEDVEAGFDYLHIDVSNDPHLGDVVPTGLGIERLADLVGAVEERRRSAGRAPVYYEVSVEHANGASTDVTAFEDFLRGLMERFGQLGLPRPLFVVGNTGTLTRMDRNMGTLDLEAAAELSRIAHRYGIVFKEHNADYLPSEALARHAEAGIGMINVAPEIGHVETKALLRLAETAGSPGSDMREVLWRHARGSDRWRKWLGTAPNGRPVDPPREIVEVCGHYFFDSAEVHAARERLFVSHRASGATSDPQRVVEDSIVSAIRRNLDALAGSRLTNHLSHEGSWEALCAPEMTTSGEPSSSRSSPTGVTSAWTTWSGPAGVC
jgi:D-tagatose-1,6-bisphosphate aldolase subunit GatZ/KbaZ